MLKNRKRYEPASDARSNRYIYLIKYLIVSKPQAAWTFARPDFGVVNLMRLKAMYELQNRKRYELLRALGLGELNGGTLVSYKTASGMNSCAPQKMLVSIARLLLVSYKTASGMNSCAPLYLALCVNLPASKLQNRKRYELLRASTPHEVNRHAVRIGLFG